jgi:hypothetical protein
MIYVDFDGTISPDHYPDPLQTPPKAGCRRVLRNLQMTGNKIIISSCRLNAELWGQNWDKYASGVYEMMQYLSDHKIPFDGLDYRKPLYDVMICDRSINFTGSWQDVETQLHEKGL